MAKQKRIPWQNRIVDHGEVDPKSLMPHPLNWRTHPESQKAVLGDVLSEVGWIQQIVVNTRTGRMVDGHLRVALAIEQNEPAVPVGYIDVSEDEERLILATLDPISALAEADANRLNSLLSSISIDSDAIQNMLAELSRKADIVPDFEPVGLDEQGKLGEIADKSVECPECGTRFTP